MNDERLEALEQELFDYAKKVIKGPLCSITRLEIRIKLDALNREIDDLTKAENTDEANILSFFAYQYYRLLYR